MMHCRNEAVILYITTSLSLFNCIPSLCDDVPSLTILQSGNFANSLSKE